MHTQSHRLASGGLVERTQTLAFQFDGRSFTGHPGDTLASALVANGVKLVGRSFKYHRPRGILSAGPEEPNALVELRTGARREPNTRATTAELYDGLVARSQNRWPSLAIDLMAVNSLASSFLAAGFYYKTFKWPSSFWELLYEPMIRRAAGLGRAAAEPDPDRYDRTYAHCDVLVIGGGPAGLLAALSAARSGARVIICDEDFRLGGQLLSERRTIDGRTATDFVADVEAALNGHPAVRVIKRTTVFGAYDGGTFGAVERVGDHLAEIPEYMPRQRYWRIVAKRAVLASGAIERPIVFGNNDLPGVMLAGAVRTFVNRFAALPGRNAVVVAGNDHAVGVVEDLVRAGVTVAAVIDPRENAEIGPSIRSNDIPQYTGSTVVGAHGLNAVRGLTVRRPDGRHTRIPCDLVAVSGGYNPSLHLATHLGMRPNWSDKIAAFVPGTHHPSMQVAGAANGSYALGECFAEGAWAGAQAAIASGFSAEPVSVPQVEPEGTAVGAVLRFESSRRKALVDFQNDVTDKDLELAFREGYRSVEHAKRYTTAGMATDQGKTGNVNAIAILAELADKSIAEIGTTTFRPPYNPVAISALAGATKDRKFQPIRRSPAHDWAAAHGAVFMNAGLWLRPRYFKRSDGESWQDACLREVASVRSGVGVSDVSTLGKFDVQGPDAAEFLDRIYCNNIKSLPVGKSRYGVMLREDGFIFDDGTVSRLGDRRFLVTTTTAHAAGVHRHLEYCQQVLWPELNVGFLSVTSQWAQFAVAGPAARQLMQRVVISGDVSGGSLPYMACREVTVLDGIRARVFRISFSGELAYEVAVPSPYGDVFVRELMRLGGPLGVTAYGLEAMDVMRIEKGHIAGGELNGKTTLHDVGLEWMMQKDRDFIGRVLSRREALTSPARPRLVGFRPVRRDGLISAGAHLFDTAAAISPAGDDGYLTSVSYSPSLGSMIGLGLLKQGSDRIGSVVRAYDPVQRIDTEVVVCPTCFVDPQGERLHG